MHSVATCFFFLSSRTAFGVEKIIRDHDVVPATVGIINGKLIVGV